MPKGDGNRGKGVTLAWIRERATYKGDECLTWPFSGTWTGYGQVGVNGKIEKAHRVMCKLAHGEPPTSGHHAAHSCRNRRCVNPKHLSWKTPRENLLDRRKDGALTRKRWNNKGTLTPAQVLKIKSLKGKKNQREIGAMFGISYQHVSVVQNNKLRRHQ